MHHKRYGFISTFWYFESRVLGATVREYYYRIDNQRDVYDPRKKNQKFCSKRPNHPKCPKSCNDGSVCYEKLCSSYGPCDDAGGKVFHVDKKVSIKHIFTNFVVSKSVWPKIM